MKAMLLAAGLGTRLKPFTDKHPKALAPVNQKTLLEWNIEYLKKYGITDMIINVHHFAQQIIDFINAHQQFGISISISDESDEVLETGGGLQKASWFFETDEPFVLMNADMLTQMDLQKMIEFHRSKKPLATLAVSMRPATRCLLFDSQNRLCGWRNKSTGAEKISIENESYIEKAFSGIHLIEHTLLNLIPFTGKFSMIDVYLELAKTQTIYAYDHSGEMILDVGKPESIMEAEKFFK